MQNTMMLYECLMASLTEEAKNAIELWREDFMVDGTGSGVLLLRVIIRESHLDSNAATSVIRTQLSRLDGSSDDAKRLKIMQVLNQAMEGVQFDE